MKGKRCLVTLPVLVCLLGSACVMPDDISRMQKDLADVRQQLRRAEQDNAEARNKLARFEASQAEQAGRDEAVTRQEIAELMVKVDQSLRDSSVARERVRDLDQRIERLSQQVRESKAAGSRPNIGPPAIYDPRPSASGDPGQVGGDSRPLSGNTRPEAESLFNTAYADFSKGNYALAISGFEEYESVFPDNPQADNAAYWIGECHFSQGNFSDAIRAFDGLLQRYPKSDRAAAANLKKALAYLEQNQIGQAIIQLRFVRSSFPGSDEARTAKDKLTSLGVPI